MMECQEAERRPGEAAAFRQVTARRSPRRHGADLPKLLKLPTSCPKRLGRGVTVVARLALQLAMDCPAAATAVSSSSIDRPLISLGLGCGARGGAEWWNWQWIRRWRYRPTATCRSRARSLDGANTFIATRAATSKLPGRSGRRPRPKLASASSVTFARAVLPTDRQSPSVAASSLRGRQGYDGVPRELDAATR